MCFRKKDISRISQFDFSHTHTPTATRILTKMVSSFNKLCTTPGSQEKIDITRRTIYTLSNNDE